MVISKRGKAALFGVAASMYPTNASPDVVLTVSAEASEPRAAIEQVAQMQGSRFATTFGSDLKQRSPSAVSFGPNDAAGWHIANYDFTHPHFDTDWRRVLVQSGPHLTLNLQPNLTADSPVADQNRFLGASIRRQARSGYGRYEARLRAAKGVGAVTGFFTYSGPYYGTRHDEIDIEFLGKDTTRVHLSWWVDGMLQTHVVPLGFDAASGVHTYAFDWHPDALRWFVDGRQIFEVKEGALPRVPGYLFFNLWAAAEPLVTWAGRPRADMTTQAEVYSVQFTPMAEAALARLAAVKALQ